MTALFEKVNRKLKTFHKMRDAKRIMKGAVRTIEESQILDSIKDALEETEKYAIASGLRTLAEIIEDTTDDLPKFKELAYEIIDDVSAWLKKRLGVTP